MSYDLYFYKRKDSNISKEQIVNYLNGIENIQENNLRWDYGNRNTGVYCGFEYYENELNAEEEQAEFTDYEDTGFVFQINFVRPQFFGKECFPLIDRLSRDLDLYILNPQGEAEPKKYEKGILFEEWDKTNTEFSKRYFKEWGLIYVELNKSNVAWEFSLNRNVLQNKLGENYFVPGIYYIKKADSHIAESLCVWPEHIPYILPAVDLIFIHKKVKGLFKTNEEEGLIRYDELIKYLGKYFEKKDQYLILHPEQAKQLEKEFNKLPLFSTFEAYGEGVHVEKIVNVYE